MSEALHNFDEMWSAYPCPGGAGEEAKRMIGGAVDAAWITNTCVVRVSRALNYSGNLVPSVSGDEILTVKGADARHYALRVAEFGAYLRRRYGPPGHTHRYGPQRGGAAPAALAGRRGLICFDVSTWSDATGHFDLWDGVACRHHAYFELADAVHLWDVRPNARPRTLSGSVGEGGRNLSADVLAVQDRLAHFGVDPGAVDGADGPQTRAAIRAFQGRFMGAPDGRVDPNGRTWRELLGL